MATWPHLLCIICTSPIFLVTSENSPKKQLLGGGGDGAGPQCFLFQQILTHKKTGKFLKYGFSIVNSTIVS
jgi:hypothetical protein